MEVPSLILLGDECWIWLKNFLAGPRPLPGFVLRAPLAGGRCRVGGDGPLVMGARVRVFSWASLRATKLEKIGGAKISFLFNFE